MLLNLHRGQKTSSFFILLQFLQTLIDMRNIWPTV